jgi:hypothetical protein
MPEVTEAPGDRGGPVIFLTARDTRADAVTGLTLGGAPMTGMKSYPAAMTDSTVRAFPEHVREARRRWSDLSPRTRRILIVTAAAEGCLKVAALIDIKRRPASQIRGSKWIWAAVVTVVNSLGGVPLAYFAFGRRREHEARPG